MDMLLALSMAGLVVIVVAQVLLRYLTDQPLAWTEECARFLFVWCCFLGAAAGARRGAHFAVDAVVNLLPGQVRTAVHLVLQLIEAAFYIALAWSGWLVTRIAGMQHSSALDIPMSLPYAAIPAGALLMALFTVLRAYHVTRVRTARGC